MSELTFQIPRGYQLKYYTVTANGIGRLTEVGDTPVELESELIMFSL